LLAVGGGGDGEVAAGDAPGGARLAEGELGVVVVAVGLAAEGGRGAGVSAFKGVRAEDTDVFYDFGAQVWIVVRHLWYPLPLPGFWTKSSWEKT
jgi:hypothetical protein